jgi:hypothetical protein
MNQQPLQLAHYRLAYQRWLACLVLLLALPLSGQQRVGFRRARTIEAETGTFGGGALIPGGKTTRRLVTWGSEVSTIRIPAGKAVRISELGGFGAGGCVVDVNHDAQPDLVLFEKGRPDQPGRMVWLEAPHGSLNVIDADADFSSCLATNMFGKEGVVVIHRHTQVRFYEIPSDPREKWPYRDVYSIYAPSEQDGLMRLDVEGNGRPDLIAGNYWLQVPSTPEKPWHIFAINKWWEGPQSARLRLALVNHRDRFPSLLAAESAASPARVALFDRPANPMQLWRESPLEAIPPIRKPEALAAADLNNDMLPDLIIGENAGDDSRLLVYWGISGGKYQGTRIDVTRGLLAVWPYDYDEDGRVDLIGLGPSTVYFWRNQALKLK